VNEHTTGQDGSTDLYARGRAYELVRAVLAAERNEEERDCAARAIATAVLAEAGTDGLAAVTVDLSLTLASALERIAADHDLAAIDLAEVWFME
jgi:hypothetical protein